MARSYPAMPSWISLVPAASSEAVELIGEVDRRLYRAKLGGRNRVVTGDG